MPNFPGDFPGIAGAGGPPALGGRSQRRRSMLKTQGKTYFYRPYFCPSERGVPSHFLGFLRRSDFSGLQPCADLDADARREYGHYSQNQGKSPPGRRRKKFLPFKLRVGSLGANIEELNDRNFVQNSGIYWASRNSGGSGTARGPHSGPRPGVEKFRRFSSRVFAWPRCARP